MKSSPLPEALGAGEAIDPFEIEPGVLLLGGRFCAVDEVRFGAETWAVTVSDVERALGEAPHHRLELHHVPLPGPKRTKLRLAAAVAGRTQPEIVHWVSQPSGELLLTRTAQGTALRTPLSDADAVAVAIALGDLLTRLHDAGIVGVAFSREQLRLRRGEVRLAGFDHLLGQGSADEDVARLTELLVNLCGDAVRDVLRPFASSARDLLDRVRALSRRPVELRLAELLPAVPPFVGREDLLHALLRHVEGARRGTAQIIAVVGEVGVGKSRLLRQLEDEIARMGPALVCNGGFGHDSDPRKSGFVGVLDRLARNAQLRPAEHQEQLAERIRRATGPLLGLVSGLSDSLRALLQEPTTPPELHLDEQFVRHATVLASTVRALGTREAPLVVLLDEGELADRASLAILRYLQDETKEHHTMVVVFSRAPLKAELDQSVADHYAMQPFSVHEVERLLATTLPGAISDRRRLAQVLWRATRGNPLALWATVQEWTEEGQLAYDETQRQWVLESDTAPPAGVVHLFRHHYRRLTVDARYLALLASLRTGTVDRGWFRAVTEWPAERVERAVFWLLARGVTVEEPGGALRIPHASLREMVLSAGGPRAARNAHRQIAQWLARTSTTGPDLAWHEEHAILEGKDEELALLHVEAGRDLLAIYNLQRAEWHFLRARARAESVAADVDAIEGLADIALLTGRVDEAMDGYLDAMARSHRPARGLEIAAKAAYGFYRRSAMTEALRLAAAALERAGEPYPANRFEAGLRIVASILGLVRRPRLPEDQRDALCRLYVVLVAITGDIDPIATLASVTRAANLARGLQTANGAAATAFGAQGLAAFSAITAWFGHPEEQLMRKAAKAAERSRDPWGVGAVHHMSGQLLLTSGEYQRGQAELDLAVSAFTRAGDQTVGVLALIVKAVYAHSREPARVVQRWLRSAEVAATRQNAKASAVLAQALNALVLARRGAPEAEPLVAETVRRLSAATEASIPVTMARAYLARALILLDDRPRARQFAMAAAEAVRGVPIVDYLIEARVARAEYLVTQKRLLARERFTARWDIALIGMLARRSVHYRGAHRLLLARYEALMDRPARARRHLMAVVASVEQHQDLWAALAAHRALAGLLAGSDVQAAAEHERRSQAFAERLGVVVTDRDDPAPNAPSSEAPPTSLPSGTGSDRSTWLDVQSVVAVLKPALEDALPNAVSFSVEVEPDCHTTADDDRFQLLLVNLVFAARDTLRSEGAVRLRCYTTDAAALPAPGAPRGPCTVIAVDAEGQGEPNALVGLLVCNEIAATLGGAITQELTRSGCALRCYFPLTGAQASQAAAPMVPQAYLVHPDPRVSATVSAALDGVGLVVATMDALPPRVDRNATYLVAAEWVDSALDLGVPISQIIVVAPRQGAPADGRFHVLKVPFALGEIERIASLALQPRASGQ